jgi:hypothetical protein
MSPTPAASGSPARHSRTALLIAYHFPPLRGSSGMQRTLRFARHLRRFGWDPVVLTIDPGAYEDVGPTTGNEIPEGIEVHRAFGFNTAKQLSIKGRYPEFLALPDRWMTWRFWAVRAGCRLVRERKVDVVWSTFPIATAHDIGREVATRTGLPWVAEFRDPMWQHDWPPEPRANAYWRAMEKWIFARADRIVFTAPSAVEMYAERFPEFPRGHFELIENGYDEESFLRAESLPPAASGVGPVILLHSGIVYRSERDPTQFFGAIAALKGAGRIDASRLRVRLRASGGEGDYRRDLQRLGIDDIVTLEPAIDYLPALREMMDVDGLLVLQASNCNAQVPAKLYEYLRSRRPILALTDPAGDTARTLDAAGAGLIARLDSQPEIEAALLEFVARVRGNGVRRPSPEVVARYSREACTGRLAALFDGVSSASPAQR